MDDVVDTLTYTATVDHDISRMENLLDQWTAELKKNVMVLSTLYIYIRLSFHFIVCGPGTDLILFLLFLFLKCWDDHFKKLKALSFQIESG